MNIDHLLAELSIAEKAALTSGSSFWSTFPVKRLDIPEIRLADGPHGLRAQSGDGDHVGLGSSIPATCFPTASAIASSWNPALLYRVGQALAQEARAMKLSVILGPGINMKRSPLCGRNFEYFSEDPYLTGELGVGLVDGIQSRGVGTSLKHYAANNQETDRLRVDVQVDERTLREIYLPAFERIVNASQPWTVMASYNKVNGTSATENTWLLQSLLREEFGFEGLVLSDWGAVYDRVPALLAGTDLEMPPALGRSPESVAAAVESGEISMAVLDTRVRKVLELIDKSADTLALNETFDLEAHHGLARAAAAESIVLLKNDDSALPLDPEARLAVIGEFARTPRFQGAGSSQVNPTRVDTLIHEFNAAYPDAGFAPAYRIDADIDDAQLLAEAVQTARAADIVVFALGLTADAESEGFDRSNLSLAANQLTALAAVAAATAQVVVVLINGSTVQLDQITPHATALVEAWLGGQAAAGGIVDVLTGVVNPSGRLAETIPHRLEDNSSYLNFPGDSQVVRYGEGLFIGYRGYDKTRTAVAYPFGYGLSYTEFELSGLAVTVHGSAADDTLRVTLNVTVTNTGSLDGAHVVQVYVEDLVSSVTRPERELKGFTKVFLAAGSSQAVTVELDQRAFSYWSDASRTWIVEAGEFTIGIGHHSRDLPLTHTIVVESPQTALPLTANSTLQEWVTDPDGRELIEKEIAAGQPATVLDAELFKVVANTPLRTLANFAGMSLDHDAVDRIAHAWILEPRH